MKIALVAQHTIPLRGERPGGQADDDIRIRELSRGLAADGHDVTVYAQRPDRRAPLHARLCPGVRVEYIGPARSRNGAGPDGPDDDDLLARMPAFAAPLRDRLDDDRPDVVHALRWTSGLAALPAARDLRIPVVQSFSPLCVTERRHHPVPPVTGAKRIRLEPAIGRTASAVLADSSDEASELARAGVPRRSVKVVPCGVDIDSFTPEGPAADRGDRPRLVTVTDLDSYEELATLLRALARVPEAELVIAGGPPRRRLDEDPAARKLNELAASLAVSDRVTFSGQVTRAGLPPLLRSADLLVNVSDYDPVGMTVLEAMACGTPVVATGTGGGVDAVVDGTTGILVPPRRPALLAERIRRLMDHPMQLAAFGVAAADRARSRYSWDRIVAETVAVYDRAADAAA
ncbi:MAG: glycosyltransferase [Nocardiopsaceae bacterium]|nr:glycosyltransferase [Nocardiopsaceae bacterium]